MSGDQHRRLEKYRMVRERTRKNLDMTPTVTHDSWEKNGITKVPHALLGCTFGPFHYTNLTNCDSPPWTINAGQWNIDTE